MENSKGTTYAHSLHTMFFLSKPQIKKWCCSGTINHFQLFYQFAFMLDLFYGLSSLSKALTLTILNPPRQSNNLIKGFLGSYFL